MPSRQRHIRHNPLPMSQVNINRLFWIGPVALACLISGAASAGAQTKAAAPKTAKPAAAAPKQAAKPSTSYSAARARNRQSGTRACARRGAREATRRRSRPALQDGRNRCGRSRSACGSRHHLRPDDQRDSLGTEFTGAAIDCQHHESDDGHRVPRERSRPHRGRHDGAERRLPRVDDAPAPQRQGDGRRPAAPAAHLFG